MMDIMVRNVDKETVRRLKEKAAAKGASLSEMAREALNAYVASDAYVKPDKAELWAEADAIRKKIGKMSGDSTAIIRADRDNKERYR